MLGDKPDVAIFADTGWEPAGVYENIEWLESAISFPIETVSIGRSLRDDVLSGVNARGREWLTIPAFMSKSDGTHGGMNWRQCTTDYKIVPIQQKARRLLGIHPRSRVPHATSIEMWLGITTDEVERMRMSIQPWIVNCYPLVENGMSREDCIAWFGREYPERVLPRSACVGCPYRSSSDWVKMRDLDETSFEDAVLVDKSLRSPDHGTASLISGEAFLHRRRIPLDEAVELDAASLKEDGDSGWGNECAGICGT